MASINTRHISNPTNAEKTKRANRNAKGKVIAAEIATALGKKEKEVDVFLNASDAVIVLYFGTFESARIKYEYKTDDIVVFSGNPSKETKDKVKEILKSHKSLIGGKRKTRKQKRRVRKTKKRSQ
jgi:2-keto-3-deoxy-galactonokinase